MKKKVRKTIINGETLFITDALPKEGDTIICIRKNSTFYGTKSKVEIPDTLSRSLQQWKVIVEPK
jgi:hypothetical protein